MFNDVTLLGNLTRDIELRYSQSGSAIASTSIATSHKYKSNGEQKEEVCFIDLTFFGRSGEIANQYLRKGSKVFIRGRLKFEQWTDNNEQKRSKHAVIVDTMKMLDNKSDRDNDARYNQPQQQAQSYQAPPTTYQDASGRSVPPPQQNNQQEYKQRQSHEQPPEIEISDEQIPF